MSSTPQPTLNDDAVTVVTSRRIKPGCEAAFEEWLEGIGKEAAKFPGVLGRKIIRPADHEHPEYVIVFKFDHYSNLKRWVDSPVRAEWLERVKPLCLDEYREQILTGLETWFTLPAKPGMMPPPPWKMAVVTLGVVWPLGLGISGALAKPLGPLPLPARSFVVSAIMICLMTWVVMPRVTRLFRRWLFAGR
jgi:antibiotic biosynthesis monooxygenase (ABM) superfamily enzyme